VFHFYVREYGKLLLLLLLLLLVVVVVVVVVPITTSRTQLPRGVGTGLEMGRSPAQGVLPKRLKEFTVSKADSKPEQAI
jgi:hypothetical protein